MTIAYPIVLTPADRGFVVYVPDLQINTEGDSLPEAIIMARDAISLWGICEQDSGRKIPAPSTQIPPHEETEIVTFVDVDFDDYRRKNDARSVKKNCTIPSWLNYQAEQAGINFSAVLQSALKHELSLSD